MASGISWRTLEQRISAAVKLQRRAVSVAFLDAPPSGVERFEGTKPSGCSFWRLAAAGRSFYTVPENHCNCAVGAYTHHLPLPPDREKETEQTLQRMFDLGYVKPEEVAQFARRPKTPAVVAYALSATHRCAGYGFVRVQVGRRDAAGRGGGKCRNRQWRSGSRSSNLHGVASEFASRFHSEPGLRWQSCVYGTDDILSCAARTFPL